MMGIRTIGHGHGHADVGVVCVGGECLRTIEHPHIAIANGSGASSCSIGPSFGFRQRPATNPLSGGKLRYVALPLLIVTSQINVIGT